MSTQRVRNWCFTSFDMDREPCYLYEKGNVQFLCYGKETCPETQKLHWQGYIQLIYNKTFSSMKKWMEDDKIHLEIAKAGSESNEKYCSKDGQYIRFGEPKQQGKRNDIHVVTEDIKNGMRYDEVAMTHSCQFIKFHRGFKELINATARSTATSRDVAVTVLVGPTGCGKTSYVYETEKDLYDMVVRKGGQQWFDGYDGQEAILLDEMSPEAVQFELLLRLIDRYPMRLDIKGSFSYAKWKRVYITSNHKIRDWYINKDKESIKALMRRINCVHDFYNMKTHIAEESGCRKIDLQITQKSSGNTMPMTFEENEEENE